ncbi:MAG: FAD-dependent oxidoreductase [Opitutaceae bacterium]|jgi:phytoene dehydrogenase-like protein
MSAPSHYDVAIIGAGMSGLAAGIRLAHFGKKVCIFERHNAAGGLNGFYSIGGRKFDVGLHAMTNFVKPGVKGTPLGKLLRQLRIDRDEFDLCEQKQSRIAFGGAGEVSLRFTNDFALFESEIAARFPSQVDGFHKLVEAVRCTDDVSLDAQPVSARFVVRRHIADPLLEDMLFCPTMYYGSARERDMEFGQFAIMFKALFLEGFARPFEGVRVIIRVLLEKYRQAGGERRMKCGVKRIIAREGRAAALILDSGEEVTADHIVSSIGSAETQALLAEETGDPFDRLPPSHGYGGHSTTGRRSIRHVQDRSDVRSTGSHLRMATAGTARQVGCRKGSQADRDSSQPARLTFVETITVLDRQPAALGWGQDTIVFFNDSERFSYEHPEGQVDVRSGVICIPNNFNFGDGRELPEGLFRCTCLANHDAWAQLPEDAYRAGKARWYAKIQDSARRFMPALPSPGALALATVTTDMFTPRTITKYTGHIGGAIYGAPEKNRQGRSSLSNLYLCGTDQGFLGIVGAMLSGISMANYHILQGGR